MSAIYRRLQSIFSYRPFSTSSGVLKIVKNIPVFSQRQPKNICEVPVNVVGTDILTFLRREQRASMNSDNRWAIFDRRSNDRVTVGSILKVTYLNSKTELNRPSSFTGFLIAIRRHPSEPTFSLKGVIDGVGVEQLFPVFSPLILKIEVVKRATKRKSYKAYWLREKPEKAAEFFFKKSRKGS